MGVVDVVVVAACGNAIVADDARVVPSEVVVGRAQPPLSSSIGVLVCSGGLGVVRGDCCQNQPCQHKLLGFLHFRILLYEFYFHQTDLNEKRPAAHSLPKECAAGLPAPDILAVFERVSSIISAVCEGLYRDKFICQRIFAENTPF